MMTCPASSTGAICLQPPNRLPSPAAMTTNVGLLMKIPPRLRRFSCDQILQQLLILKKSIHHGAKNVNIEIRRNFAMDSSDGFPIRPHVQLDKILKFDIIIAW